jgi:hypothetical protein
MADHPPTFLWTDMMMCYCCCNACRNSGLMVLLVKTVDGSARKVLLALEDHESHKYRNTLYYAAERNSLFQSFAHHTTHKMQHLHIVVYGPLKMF